MVVTGLADSSRIGAILLTGVNQSAPFRGHVTGGTNSVATEVGDLVLQVIGAHSTGGVY